MSEDQQKLNPVTGQTDKQAPRPSSTSSYTPTPVKKKRSVTQMNLAAVSDLPDDTSDQQKTDESLTPSDSAKATSSVAPSPAAAPVPVQVTPARPASIQFNMDTMDVIAHSLVETEQKRQTKLAEFEPLSMTLMGEVTPAPVVQESSWEDSEWGASDADGSPTRESDTGLHSFEHESSEFVGSMSDVYKSRRRMTASLILIMVASAWFIGMSMQIGVERLVADPYGETAEVMFGVAKPSSVEVEEEPLPAPVAIQHTQPELTVDRVERVGRARGHLIFAIHIALNNPSESSLSAARVKLTLRSPLSVKQSWVKRFEFNCCLDSSLEDREAGELRALFKQLVTGAYSQDSQIKLEPGELHSFTYLVPLKSALRVGADMPRAELELLFAE